MTVTHDALTREQREYRRMENVAALCADIFSSSVTVAQLEEKADNFAGRLALIIDAAQRLEEAARNYRVEWDETHDWVEVIERLIELWLIEDQSIDDAIDAVLLKPWDLAQERFARFYRSRGYFVDFIGDELIFARPNQW